MERFNIFTIGVGSLEYLVHFNESEQRASTNETGILNRLNVDSITKDIVFEAKSQQDNNVYLRVHCLDPSHGIEHRTK